MISDLDNATTDHYALFLLVVISFLIANHTVMSNYKMKELNGEWSLVGHMMVVLFHWAVGVVSAGIVFTIILVISWYGSD